MLYRDDYEAARAKAEALERALARSLAGLTAAEGAMAQLERRLERAVAVGNLCIILAAAVGLGMGFLLVVLS